MEKVAVELQPGKLQTFKPVHHSTIALWFHKHFGVGSEHGHTEIHPHKSDVCPVCAQIEMDLQSLTASLKRVRAQPDKTAKREADIVLLHDGIKQLEEAWEEHTNEAKQAHEHYVTKIEDAHQDYCFAVRKWQMLLSSMAVDAETQLNAVEKASTIEKFVKAVSGIALVLSHDYQQDKQYPAWHKSPQPGPTYFMSSITAYVHIFCADSLGLAEGPTRFARNHVYIRPEPVGGSKDSNDTCATLFDFLLGVPEPTTQQPSLFRTGYGPEGAIPNFEPHQAASNRPSASCNAVTGIIVPIAHVPQGHTLAQKPPESAVLEFRNPKGHEIVGRDIVCYWPEHGWCHGSIIAQNESLSYKDRGHHVNFLVKYHGETGEAFQALLLQDYSTSAEANPFAWAMLWQCILPTEPEASLNEKLLRGMIMNLIKSTELHPFLRELKDQMDNCAGTNKSQFTVGFVALLICLGVLDVACLDFMLPYHGKFGPDLVAQKTACHYNHGDTFNLAMLLEHFSPYCSVRAYDGNLLHTWKEGTVHIFRPVQNITSYRRFMLIADDGNIELKHVNPPPDVSERFPNSGKFYSEVDLHEAARARKERSLHGIVSAVLAGTYTGIGAGAASGIYSSSNAQLLPSIIKKVDNVRLFMKVRDSDVHWIEQVSYQKTKDPSAVSMALQKVIPFSASTIPGSCRSDYWGARAAQITEQYAKYVPTKHVPDEYSINCKGTSGLLSGPVQHVVFNEVQSAIAIVSEEKQTQVASDDGDVIPPNKRQKYDRHTHDKLLIAACCSGKAGKPQAPKKAVDIRRIQMEVDPQLSYQSVRSALKRMVENGILAQRT